MTGKTGRPALDPADVPAVTGSGYPEPFKSRVSARRKQRLGDALGLKNFGVNLTTIPPGATSALRHWHSQEDEFVYVVEGEITLRTDAGETVLRAGMCAGFPAGDRNGHHLINKTDKPVRYLEVSNRDPEDTAEYSDPDVDLAYRKGPNGEHQFTRRDGSSF